MNFFFSAKEMFTTNVTVVSTQSADFAPPRETNTFAFISFRLSDS